MAGASDHTPIGMTRQAMHVFDPGIHLLCLALVVGREVIEVMQHPRQAHLAEHVANKYRDPAAAHRFGKNTRPALSLVSPYFVLAGLRLSRSSLPGLHRLLLPCEPFRHDRRGYRRVRDLAQHSNPGGMIGMQ